MTNNVVEVRHAVVVLVVVGAVWILILFDFLITTKKLQQIYTSFPFLLWQ